METVGLETVERQFGVIVNFQLKTAVFILSNLYKHVCPLLAQFIWSKADGSTRVRVFLRLRLRWEELELGSTLDVLPPILWQLVPMNCYWVKFRSFPFPSSKPTERQIGKQSRKDWQPLIISWSQISPNSDTSTREKIISLEKDLTSRFSNLISSATDEATLFQSAPCSGRRLGLDQECKQIRREKKAVREEMRRSSSTAIESRPRVKVSHTTFHQRLINNKKRSLSLLEKISSLRETVAALKRLKNSFARTQRRPFEFEPPTHFEKVSGPTVSHWMWRKPIFHTNAQKRSFLFSKYCSKAWVLSCCVDD